MRSRDCVLLTAIRTISSDRRPARRVAAAMRSWIDAMLAATDMRRVVKNHPSLREGRGQEGLRHTSKPHKPYIMAVGGAGSFGSPAAETGMKIIKAAKPARTIIPPTR